MTPMTPMTPKTKAKRAISTPGSSEDPATTGGLLAHTLSVLLLSTFPLLAVANTLPSNGAAAEPSEAAQHEMPSSHSPDHMDADYLHIEQQIDVGELREARTELESTISRLQRTGDRYDGKLVAPLRLLGRVFHEQGDYPRAAETLALATQISRVANGLHSAEQLELVHEEIRSLKAMGNIVEANRRHEYAFSIARRHFGRYGEGLIPELLKIGVWYTSTGDVIGARDRFAEARLLLSANPETAESDDMLFALRGIARSYRDEAFPPFYSRPDKETADLYERNGLTDRQIGIREDMAMRTSINSFHRGAETLIDIVRIEVNRLADKQDALLQAQATAASATDSAAEAETASEEQADTPSGDADLLAQSSRGRDSTVSLEQLEPAINSASIDKGPLLKALLDLGDWYLLMEKESRAFGYYQHAYRVAEKDPNSDPVALFGKPTLLYFPRPRDPKIPEMAPRESFEEGFVDLMYDIDHRGEIKRLRTTNSQPPGLMDFNVRSSARVARYRPKIIDGLPQPAQEQTYRHKFEYFPRDRETVPAKVIDSDMAESGNQASSGQ